MSWGFWSQALAPMEGRADCNEQEGKIGGKKEIIFGSTIKFAKTFSL